MAFEVRHSDVKPKDGDFRILSVFFFLQNLGPFSSCSLLSGLYFVLILVGFFLFSKLSYDCVFSPAKSIISAFLCVPFSFF